MPLPDHFRPPLSRTPPWRGFHGAWAAATARVLNGGVLPTGYYAVPFLTREGPVEIDVATLEPFSAPLAAGADSWDGPADASRWQPAAPALAVAVEWPAADQPRVEVYCDAGDPRLAAAIEFVSPSNKDRPESRRAFVEKSAGHLRGGVGVLLIDVVTTRRADLNADLLATLGTPAAADISPGPLWASSYRAVARGGSGLLEAWPVELRLGAPLPTLPLGIAADLAVPLDLEVTHTATCDDLRVPRAG